MIWAADRLTHGAIGSGIAPRFCTRPKVESGEQKRAEPHGVGHRVSSNEALGCGGDVDEAAYGSECRRPTKRLDDARNDWLLTKLGDTMHLKNRLSIHSQWSDGRLEVDPVGEPWQPLSRAAMNVKELDERMTTRCRVKHARLGSLTICEGWGIHWRDCAHRATYGSED